MCVWPLLKPHNKMVFHEPLPGCGKYLSATPFVKPHHSSFPSEPPLEIDLSHPDAGWVDGLPNPAPVDRWFIHIYHIYW